MIEASEASGKLPSFSTTVCHSTTQNVNSHTLSDLRKDSPVAPMVTWRWQCKVW